VADSTVRIGLVLPDVMGTYGDGGNAVVLRQRLLLRGIDASIVEITLSDPVPASLDIYTLGGAEDYAQRLATKHLLRYPGLQQAVSRGAPVLAICAAIQVLATGTKRRPVSASAVSGCWISSRHRSRCARSASSSAGRCWPGFRSR